MNEGTPYRARIARATATKENLTHERPDARRRIDPRVGIIVLLILNVFAFLSPSLPAELIALGLNTALMIWCGRTRLALAWLCGYLVVMGVIALCILGGSFFFPIAACFTMFRRLLPVAMFAAALISTTHVGEMACALQSFGLTGRKTVAVCVALRFFPTVAREARAVREAMLTRGIHLDPKTIITRPRALLENFMVPFIHRISIVADELGDAVMVRGIEAGQKRTCYHSLRLGAVDVIVLLVALGLLASAIVTRFFS